MRGPLWFFDCVDPKGTPSHSKVLATLGYIAGWAFLFVVRPHEMTVGWTTYVVVLNGLPWGLNGFKAALNARKPPEG